MERARPAEPADMPRLVELCHEARAELSARRGGSQLVAAVLAGRSVPDRLADALAAGASLVVAGELGGAVVGVGAVHVDARTSPPNAVVDVLFVEPDGRGVGLGEAMMAAMVEWAHAQGCAGIDATALPGSREAKSFFETHGLVARALIMHRTLPAAFPDRMEG